MGEEAIEEVVEHEEAPESQEESVETTVEVVAESAETELEEEEAAIPQERFNKVYGEKKAIERKLDLLRTDPEAYYETFPDERPEPAQPEPTPIPKSIQDIAGFVVYDQNSEHNGKTFEDVYREDPFAAQVYYENYRNELAANEQSAAEQRTAIEQDVEQFQGRITETLFGAEEITPEQQKEVDAVTQETIDWMKANDRMFLSMNEAFFLKNRGKLLKGEQVKGINALVNVLGAEGVPAVGGNGAGTGDTGTEYGRMLGMSSDALAEAIEDMSDSAFKDFKKNAPPALKKKHPGLNW